MWEDFVAELNEYQGSIRICHRHDPSLGSPNFPNVVIDINGLARSITALGNTRWILDDDSKYFRARLITPVESLRLMGFTGIHEIGENDITEETAKEIAGNAVPVHMATKVSQGLYAYHSVDFMMQHVKSRTHRKKPHSCRYCKYRYDTPEVTPEMLIKCSDDFSIETTEEEQTLTDGISKATKVHHICTKTTLYS